MLVGLGVLWKFVSQVFVSQQKIMNLRAQVCIRIQLDSAKVLIHELDFMIAWLDLMLWSFFHMQIIPT